MVDEEKQAEGELAAEKTPPELTPAKPAPEPAAPSAEATELADLKARYAAQEAQLKEEQARRSGLDRKLTEIQKATPGAGISQAQYWVLRRDNARIRDEQRRSTNPDDTGPSYEAQLDQELKAEEQVTKTQWESHVRTTLAMVVRNLDKRGVAPESVWQHPQFKTLWDKGFVDEAADFALAFTPGTPPIKPGAELEESEDEKVNRRAKEMTQAELKKRGLKATDEGSSGRNPSREAIRDAFIQNPRDPQIRQRYLQMRREQGRT